MVSFEKYKTDILEKTDKSKKGDIDDRIKQLCGIINKSSSYFTSSSCSGRVMLMKKPFSNKKNEVEWILVTHELARFSDFKEAVDAYHDSEVLMFKQESAILHVCCRTIEDAQALIDAAKQSGFKRSGIFSTKKKIFVEMICTEGLYTPVFDSRRLIDDGYLQYLIVLANEKMKISWKAIERFEKNLGSA